MVYVEIDFNTCEYCGHQLEDDDMFNSWLCDCYCDCRLLKEDCEECYNEVETDKNTHCAYCGVELTPEIASARSNHQCVSCHIKHPKGCNNEEETNGNTKN